VPTPSAVSTSVNTTAMAASDCDINLCLGPLAI
jgi:hypothetical protein